MSGPPSPETAVITDRSAALVQGGSRLHARSGWHAITHRPLADATRVTFRQPTEFGRRTARRAQNEPTPTGGRAHRQKVDFAGWPPANGLNKRGMSVIRSGERRPGSEDAEAAGGSDGGGTRADVEFAEGVGQVGVDGGGPMKRAAAISRSERPSATSVNISTSRGVRSCSAARLAVSARALPGSHPSLGSLRPAPRRAIGAVPRPRPPRRRPHPAQPASLPRSSRTRQRPSARG